MGGRALGAARRSPTRRCVPDSPGGRAAPGGLADSRGALRLSARAGPRPRRRDPARRRRRGPRSPTRVSPPSPRTTPSTSSAARPRSRRCGGSSERPPRCSRSSGPRVPARASFLRAGLIARAAAGLEGPRDRRPAIDPARRSRRPGPRASRVTPRRWRELLPVEEPTATVAPSGALAPAPRARAGDRRPVRGALHAQPADDAAGASPPARPPRARRRRPRAPVAARRLPDPLPRARAARARSLRPHRCSAPSATAPCGEPSCSPRSKCGYRFEDDDAGGRDAGRRSRASAAPCRCWPSRLPAVGEARPRDAAS